MDHIKPPLNGRPVDQPGNLVKRGALLNGTKHRLLTNPAARHDGVPFLFLQKNQKDNAKENPIRTQVS